jgi:hypothetical protein
MELTHPSKVRIFEPFLGFILFAVVAVYLINAFNTENLLWFRGNTTHVTPSRIIVIEDGKRTALLPGQVGFAELSAAVTDSLSKLNNNGLVEIGLSAQTLQDYDESGLLLELHFDKPVVFNTNARTGEPKMLLIPIRGRHADSGYVFRGDKGEWWFGAVRMANPTPLLTTLEEMGYTAVSPQFGS